MNDKGNFPSDQVGTIPVASMGLVPIVGCLILYTLRYGGVWLWCRVCPLKWCFRSTEFLGYAKSPAALRREIRRDLNTLIQRMGRRVAALPNYCLVSGLPVFELDRNSKPCPNTRTLAYMPDIERFYQANPLATTFDEEIFRIGWLAGNRI